MTIDDLYCIVLDNMNYVLNQMYYVNDMAGLDDAVEHVDSAGDALDQIERATHAHEVLGTENVHRLVVELKE